ncbi:MAG: MraY family glycosyltransferase [Sphingobacterium sp.]
MSHLVLLIIAVFGGLIFTYLAKALAINFKFVSRPNPIVPQHIKPIAYLGGAGIFGGLGFAIVYMVLTNYEIENDLALGAFPVAILVGSVGFLLLGIVDDLKVFKASSKLSLQIAIAITCVLLGLKGTFTSIYMLDVVLTVFWILFMVNAANLIDVCDGLLAGIMAVTFLAIGFYFPALTVFCFIIAGSTIGFLVFNFPPASIFLGDAGSHLLGFLIATLGILQSGYFPHLDGLIWMTIIAAVPIFELLFITTMRIKQGVPWWKGSPDHFSLRLQSVGLTKLEVNLISWSISLFCTLSACYFLSFGIVIKLVICCILMMLFIVNWRYLAKIEINRTKTV